MLRFCVLIFSFVVIGACSSDSYLAKSSARSMGELSPVGSRQVVRQKQLALATHYRINVGLAGSGLRGEGDIDLNQLATETLSQHLKHYFVHVNRQQSPMSLSKALQQAAAQGDQLLMYPRIERWPNIKPLRVHECEDEQGKLTTSLYECDHDPGAQEDSDDLVLTIAVYDVVGGMQVDAITARSSIGVKSYLFEDSVNELRALNEMVVNRLASQANLH